MLRNAGTLEGSIGEQSPENLNFDISDNSDDVTPLERALEMFDCNEVVSSDQCLFVKGSSLNDLVRQCV